MEPSDHPTTQPPAPEASSPMASTSTAPPQTPSPSRKRSRSHSPTDSALPDTCNGPKKRKVVDEQALRFPLHLGWQRQTRIRTVEGHLEAEVVYFAPCGRNMKRYPQVKKYLMSSGTAGLSDDNFSFSTKIKVGDFYEATEGPEGLVWRTLTEEEFAQRIVAMYKRRNGVPKTEQPFDDCAETEELKLQRKLQAEELKVQRQAARQAAKDEKRQQAMMAAENRKRKREEDTLLKQEVKKRKLEATILQKAEEARVKEEKRIALLEEKRKEKELRAKQMLEDKERKRQAMILQKAEEARIREEKRIALLEEKRKEKELHAKQMQEDKERQCRAIILAIAEEVCIREQKRIALLEEKRKEKELHAKQMLEDKERQCGAIMLVKDEEARIREEKRIALLEEKRKEKELRAKQMLEDKERKRQAMILQKAEEARIREEKRIALLEEKRKEKELRAKQMLEEKEMKRQAMILQKAEEARIREEKRIALLEEKRKEKELRAKQMLEEKEMKRQAMILQKAEEARVKEEKRIALLEEKRKEKELRAKQMLEEKERQCRAMILQKAEEARIREEKRIALLEEKRKEKELRAKQMLEEKELKRKLKDDQARLNKERKLELRRLEQIKAKELKEELKNPKEDMCLTDHKPLPELSRIPGLILSGGTFSSSLAVLQFTHSFGNVLKLGKRSSLLNLNDFQKGLLNTGDSEGKVQDLLVGLLSAAVHDPGIPPGCRNTTASGEPLTSVYINRDNVSEILQIFMEGHHHHTEAASLALSLKTKDFRVQTPSMKASMLEFLVNVLCGNTAVIDKVNQSMDEQKNLKRDKWLVQTELYRLKEVHRAEKTNGIIKCEIDYEKEADRCVDQRHEDEEETRPKTANKTETGDEQDKNLPSAGMTDLEKDINDLCQELRQIDQKLFDLSLSMQSTVIGQDRYKRNYWILPQWGGVLVEATAGDEGIEDTAAEAQDQPCPQPIPVDMRHGWWTVSSLEELQILVNALHRRGNREKELCKKIKDNLGFITVLYSRRAEGVTMSGIGELEQLDYREDEARSSCEEQKEETDNLNDFRRRRRHDDTRRNSYHTKKVGRHRGPRQ